MVETCVFWFVLLQFSAVSSQTSTSITVGSGEKVTLPCENVIKSRPECDSTTWIVNSQSSSKTEELFNLGKPRETSQSDRLSLTSDCSLVIEKVRTEDVGLYTCRQFPSNKQQGQDAQINLSVIDITQSIDKVTLTCSVFTHGGCRHTVEWQIKETRNTNIHPSASACSSTADFLSHNRNSESFTCKVTDKNNNHVLLCKPLTPCRRETGVDKTTTTPTTTSATTSTSTQTTKSNKDVNVTTTAPQNTSIKDYWWVFVAAAVVVFVVLLIIGLRIRSKRKEDNQTQENNNNTGDPEGSYVTISFTNTKNHRHQTTGGDHAVTYSSVRAASTDPSDPVYSTIK